MAATILPYDGGRHPAAFRRDYPFGQSMDARSYNAGFSDARYKYTEKERDQETGYDYPPNRRRTSPEKRSASG